MKRALPSLAAIVLGAALSCGPPALGEVSVRTCTLDGQARGAGPTTASALEALLDQVQVRLFPELDLVEVGLAANARIEGETSFLQANLDPWTAWEPAYRRRYLVRYSPLLLEDPPPANAVAAILAHELRHVADYVAMDTAELAGFALGYVTVDPAPYERRTDRWVVALGCSAGLKAYREWIYPRLDEVALAEKRRVYLTPEEIDALVEQAASAE